MNGKGDPMRRKAPEIPDFTDVNWQKKRADADLLASILDGKGLGMPPAPVDVEEEQAQGLLAYVRAFAPTTRRTPSLSDPDKEFAALKKQLRELQREFNELSKPRPAITHRKPAESSKSAGGAVLLLAREDDARRQLFEQHCAKCHGPDGSGSRARRRYPDIPDFTDPGWQAQHSDAQMLASILDGKGAEMPALSHDISQEQARALLPYIRALGVSQQRKGSR
jgi:mono/diheme cytochrome c family protein